MLTFFCHLLLLIGAQKDVITKLSLHHFQVLFQGIPRELSKPKIIIFWEKKIGGGKIDMKKKRPNGIWEPLLLAQSSPSTTKVNCKLPANTAEGSRRKAKLCMVHNNLLNNRQYITPWSTKKITKPTTISQIHNISMSRILQASLVFVLSIIPSKLVRNEDGHFQYKRVGSNRFISRAKASSSGWKLQRKASAIAWLHFETLPTHLRSNYTSWK